MFANTSKWINYLMYFSLKSYMWILYSKPNFNFRLNSISKRNQYLSDSLCIDILNFTIKSFKPFRWRQHNYCIYQLAKPTITKQSFNKFQWLSKYFLYPLSFKHNINCLPHKCIQRCWCFIKYCCINLCKRSFNNKYIKLSFA